MPKTKPNAAVSFDFPALGTIHDLARFTQRSIKTCRRELERGEGPACSHWYPHPFQARRRFGLDRRPTPTLATVPR